MTDAPAFEFEYQEPEARNIMQDPKGFHAQEQEEEVIEPRLFTDGGVEGFPGDGEISDLDIRTVALQAVIEHQRISPGLTYPSLLMAADGVATWLRSGVVPPEAQNAMLGAPTPPQGTTDPTEG